MLAHPRTIYRVAEINGEIVGLVVLYRGVDDDEANLSAIYVTQTVFGKGIGQALFDTALFELGDKPVRVTVAPYNQRAIAFYRRNGFEDVADSQGRAYFDGANCWILWQLAAQLRHRVIHRNANCSTNSWDGAAEVP